MDAADLGVVEAAALIAERRLSASELTRACLARIRERDGAHSHEGDAASVNAWVRVYEEEALAAAAHVDDARALADGPLPQLCGIPIGLKDLYGVAGEPLTARAACSTSGRSRTATSGAGSRAGDDPARPPPHARVRGRRDDRPGRQPVGARALSGRIERRLGRGARRAHGARGHGDGHGRLAADPVGAVRHLDDQADARARVDARCRAARHEPRPRRARWRARWRIARRSWPRWRGRIRPPGARSQPAPTTLPAPRTGASRWPACASRSRPASTALPRRRRRRRPRCRDRAVHRAGPASSHRPRRASRSTSATTSSTSSTPSC